MQNILRLASKNTAAITQQPRVSHVQQQHSAAVQMQGSNWHQTTDMSWNHTNGRSYAGNEGGLCSSWEILCAKIFALPRQSFKFITGLSLLCSCLSRKNINHLHMHMFNLYSFLSILDFCTADCCTSLLSICNSTWWWTKLQLIWFFTLVCLVVVDLHCADCFLCLISLKWMDPSLPHSEHYKYTSINHIVSNGPFRYLTQDGSFI